MHAAIRPKRLLIISHCPQPLGPTSYPAHLHASSIEASQVMFTWSELKCSDRRGPITGYVVKFYNQTEHTIVNVDGAKSTSFTAYHFQPNTLRQYGLSVAAVNTVGSSDFSPPVWVNTPRRICGWLQDLTISSP